MEGIQPSSIKMYVPNQGTPQSLRTVITDVTDLLSLLKNAQLVIQPLCINI